LKLSLKAIEQFNLDFQSIFDKLLIVGRILFRPIFDEIKSNKSMDSSRSKQEQEKSDQALLDCPLLFDCKAMTGAIANCCNYLACLAASPAPPPTSSPRPFRYSRGSLVVTRNRFEEGWAIATELPYEYSCQNRTLTVLTTQIEEGWAIAIALPYEYSCQKRILTVLTTLESGGYYTATALCLAAERKK
jgi:hypothetical protein